MNPSLKAHSHRVKVIDALVHLAAKYPAGTDPDGYVTLRKELMLALCHEFTSGYELALTRVEAFSGELASTGPDAKY